MPNDIGGALHGPLSDQTLDRLRISAAMALAFPQVAVKVRVGDQPCLEVRWTPAPGVVHRVLAPCAFHRAVASALRMRRSGERVAMCGVPSGQQPAIDWGVAADARILLGGIVRVDAGPVWRHGGAVLGEAGQVLDALDSRPGLTAWRDEEVGVTIVGGASTKGDEPASRAVVEEVLGVVAHVGVLDLEHRLNGRPYVSDPRS